MAAFSARLALVAMFTAGIWQGTAAPHFAAPAAPPADTGPVHVEDVPWSFRPLNPPVRPAVKNEAWCRGDIDRFILARLEQDELSPNPPADRRTLIRRAAFDLTGLPPTPEEVDAFVNDRAGDDEAFARVVDHYLRSARFGERWGRHWLDIVRYADSTGRSWNAPLTYAWRYRDWVIDALNADLPFDEFVTQQLAGDLMPSADRQQARSRRIATGFLALGAADLQNLSYEQFVLDVVDDQIDVTTRALLGLSVACARCHDHKYDPVTMRDYYALAGIFYSTRTLPGVAHQREVGREGYVHPSRLVVLPAESSSAAAARVPGVHSMDDYQDQWRSGQRQIRFVTDPNLAIGAAEGDLRDCEVRVQGDPYDRREAPPRGDVQIPGLPRMENVAAGDSGRLELARWITSDRQPLAARVMANRIWHHLFGAGLVITVDDFGVNSDPPSHPELLDHLAIEFRRGGWSVKQLIRQVMLSQTYRQSSAGQPAALEKDPQNRLCWRMNVRRLELEPLRDSLLAVAGSLTLDRPAGIQVSGIGGKAKQSQTASLLPLDAPYRTVYLPVIRAGVPEEYGTFDFPDPCLPQGAREVTTVAPQALFFMNGRFVLDGARQTAQRLLAAEPDPDRRIAAAYRRVLGRPPTAEEAADAQRLLGELEPDGAERDPEAYRWTVLVQALLASAEFRYVR